MNYIQGKDCLFQIDLGSGYQNFACVKNFSIDIDTDEKETTFVNDGNWKDFDYKSLSYSIQLDSVLLIQDGVKPSAFDMMEYQTGFIEVKYRMLFQKDNLVKSIKGIAIVKKSTFGASAAQLADSSVTLFGKGAFTAENSLPEYINLNIVITGDPSIAALGKFKLINADNEIIFDSGLLPGANGGNLPNPTNVTAQVQKGTYAYFWAMDAESDHNTFVLSAAPGKTTTFGSGNNSESSFGIQNYDFNSDASATFNLVLPTPPPSCVSPGGIPSTMPDGKTFVNYYYSFAVSGTGPFTLSDITKPAWMTIAISGNVITFSGMPRGGDDVDSEVILTVNNACGNATFDANLHIATNTDVATINYSYSTSVFGNFRLYDNGNPAISPLISSGAGSIDANGGDVMEVALTIVGHTKHTIVTDVTTSTVLFDNTSSSTSQSFTWTAVAGNTYSIVTTVS